jgi:dTDP-4-dehydrorhamnose reductase
MAMLILGDGVIGSEFARQTGWEHVSRRKDGFDFTNIQHVKSALVESHHGVAFSKRTDTVINCVGCVDTFGAKEKHWDINYRYVCDLTDACNDLGIKLVHISADYVHHNSKPNAGRDDIPIHGDNWYSYTKLLADAYVQLRSHKYLILRGGGMKARPFPYEGAFADQIGNFDYVDNVVKAFVKLIEDDAVGLWQVGRKAHTVYDLAVETRDVTAIPTIERCPKNVTMELDICLP